MRTNFFKLTIIITVILFFFGCFAFKKTTPPLDKKPDEEVVDFTAYESCYYYFTEAQLQR